MLSIIVPVLNEGKRLLLLLESIKKQNYDDDLEVIVADGGSKDETIEVAQSFGCKVVSGDLPARGRNEGAKIARGDLFLFVDGDSVLPVDFLQENVKEFKERGLDVAGFRLYPYGRGTNFNLIYDLFYNWPALALEKYLAHATNTVLVKKTLHQEIEGFDEGIRIAEDHDYARKGAKIAAFGIVRASPLLAATRRFDCDGWAKTYLKYILCELHMIYLGPVKSDIFKYRLGHYEEKKTGKPVGALNKLMIPFQMLWKVIIIMFVLVVSALVSLVCVLGLAAGIGLAKLNRRVLR